MSLPALCYMLQGRRHCQDTFSMVTGDVERLKRPNCQRVSKQWEQIHTVCHGKHKQDAPGSAALSLNYAVTLFTLCFIQQRREESHLICVDSTV